MVLYREFLDVEIFLIFDEYLPFSGSLSVSVRVRELFDINELIDLEVLDNNLFAITYGQLDARRSAAQAITHRLLSFC
jgi:hypothetical protein